MIAGGLFGWILNGWPGNGARTPVGAAGVELGPVREVETEDGYSAELEGISREFFRMREGKPAIRGGEHAVTVAMAVIREAATLLNQVLQAKRRRERFATIMEMSSVLGGVGPALVMLDDELAYLMMWSPAIHNYCRRSEEHTSELQSRGL